MANTRVYHLKFAAIYPLYVEKLARKDHTLDELNQIIEWLTGYDAPAIQAQITDDVDLETFFKNATINPRASLITGVICGIRVENIADPLMQQIRYLDKLVDEVAKGKAMNKVLR
ncbi:DUF2200 domain-containing protein [Lapidilactobacillus bayanensis]|uniref:DUF2200 domain-containing protein n=1 Tax=Lapidilactobacillus bayanensis TaxID=2485998 RepID=UPI000F7A4D25|nr:DUF2200 domain-containing protein [Lapidilactobacillus bayanensis]